MKAIYVASTIICLAFAFSACRRSDTEELEGRDQDLKKQVEASGWKQKSAARTPGKSPTSEVDSAANWKPLARTYLRAIQRGHEAWNRQLKSRSADSELEAAYREAEREKKDAKDALYEANPPETLLDDFRAYGVQLAKMSAELSEARLEFKRSGQTETPSSLIEMEASYHAALITDLDGMQILVRKK